MRTRTSVLVVIGLLATAWAATGQSGPRPEGAQSPAKKQPEKAPAGPKADTLEEAFETALQFNTDIKAAEFKVREAEHQLQLVRQQVFGRIAVLRQEIDAAEKTIAHSRALREIANLAYQKGAGSFQDLKASEANVAKDEAAIARIRAELDATIGKWGAVPRANTHGLTGMPGMPPGNVRLWDLEGASGGTIYLNDVRRLNLGEHVTGHATIVEKPMADRIRAALSKTVKLDESANEVPLNEVLDLVRRKAGIDVPFRLLLSNKETHALTIPKGELPVGAWLQAFEDSLPDVRFLVRDYGILVTTRSRTPDGAMRVSEFWKQSRSPDQPNREAQTEPK